MGKQFTVSDGKMMLILEEAEEGGFVVTSPLDPGLVTQAETLQEAFLMAYDAAECLVMGRQRLAERLGLTDASKILHEAAPTSPEATVPKRSSKGHRGNKSGQALNS